VIDIAPGSSCEPAADAIKGAIEAEIIGFTDSRASRKH